MADLDSTARREEEIYVHQVYENIAEHFSRTRYKPWPGISNFFRALPPGSLGIDAGCGNGKYLGLRSVILAASTSPHAQNAAPSGEPSTSKSASTSDSVRHTGIAGPDGMAPAGEAESPILTIGLDRSSGLVKIAKGREHEVLVGDAIDMPWRDGAFDFAISIATIHHFTNRSRRKEAIKTILRAINKKHGKLFIQVWALEQGPPGSEAQEPNSGEDRKAGESTPKPIHRRTREMSKLPKASLESVDAATAPKAGQSGEATAQAPGNQDVFVPWKLQPKPEAKPKAKVTTGKGRKSAPNKTAWDEKIRGDAEPAMPTVAGQRATTVEGTVGEQGPAPQEEPSTAQTEPTPLPTYQRYYHLFTGGELRELVVEAAQEMSLEGKLQIDEEEEWEQGNWCIQARFVA